MATRVTEKTQPGATGSERSKAREGKEFFGFTPSIFLGPFLLPPNGRRCLGNLGGPVPRDAEVSWEKHVKDTDRAGKKDHRGWRGRGREGRSYR